MDWIQGIMETYGYLGIAFIIALENLFPPIPSELILPFAGYMTTTSNLSFLGVLLASTIGSVVGAIILYVLGSSLGRKGVSELVKRYGASLKISEESLAKTEYWFNRFGVKAVFLCRMVPVVRSLISIPAGIAKMEFLRFLLYTTLGTLIWNTLLILGGMLLGTAWSKIAQWVGYYQDLVLILLGLLLCGWLVWQFLLNNKDKHN